MLAVLNPGTIPDRGLYRVKLVGEGQRLGELDEEMVFETRRGDAIILGASTWRVEEITRDEVRVSPAPGEPGRLPFWRGESPGRPLSLGRAMGDLTQAVSSLDHEETRAWLTDNTPLDENAAANLSNHVREQKEITGALPTATCIIVERFRDELGDWRLCLLSPLGSRVLAPWAMAIEAKLSAEAGFDVRAMWTDDGIALRFADTEVLPPIDDLLIDPEDVEELVMQQLAQSPMFATRFREIAGRALLLPRRAAKGRTPLWLQRKRSSTLLAAALRFPAFPMVLETYRECLQDVFDVPALKELLGDLRSRKVRVEEVETKRASPFARSLVFQYTAAYLYDGDAPLAERRALALTVDRELLRELLGQDQLAELLVPEAVEAVAFELQGLAEGRRARDANELADLLRRLGDLTPAEMAARCEGDPLPWLDKLSSQRRALRVRIVGEERWIAAQDAARYRDALGVSMPQGVPAPFLEPVDVPLERLCLRYAATHAPFDETAMAARFGLPVEAARSMLAAMASRGLVLRGRFRPGMGDEWCHSDVLKRLKRRSLALLRQEVEAVDDQVLARFLPAWHGLDSKRSGISRLADVVVQLEGLPLSFLALESEVLPARVHGFAPLLLDQLGAMGGVAWIGRGALGTSDGRVALYRRDRVHLLVDPPPETYQDGDALHEQLLSTLRDRGACFLTDLQRISGRPGKEVTTAMWDLVWAGMVTNDTFQPLRGLQGGRRGRLPVAGGRWYRVADLVGQEVSSTERALARASSLLERYGVVGRQMAAADKVQGGYAGMYPVLREMADAGKVRRGRFVDGLSGAQFALPGAVDRLRACRDDGPGERVMAATDPANPWGAILSWPARPEGLPPLRRVPGARVVLIDGVPVLYLSRKRLLTLPAATHEDGVLDRAVGALSRSLGYKRISITDIDGQPAKDSDLTPRLLDAGFERDFKGLALGR
jgi:ATP-dependent Lhr-like helicase